MRTVYFAPSNTGPFDLVLHHRKLLQALKEAAPELEIIPNDEQVPSYSALSFLPNNEKHFREQFEVLTEARDTGNRISVCHAIRLRSSLQEIKFKQTNNFLNYLKSNNITVIQDKFSRQRISSVGFFIGVHPDMAHRGFLASFIKELLQSKVNLKQRVLHELPPDYKDTNTDEDELDDKVDIPAFELIISNVNFGSDDDRIPTRAIDVLVATPHARLLKAILAEIDFQTWLQQGRFVGRGYMHMNTEEDYRAALNFQNDFINDTICFSISGLTTKASQEYVTWNSKRFTLKDILCSNPAIINVYPTAAIEEHGKWLVLTTRNDYKQASSFFDQIIPGFFAALPKTTDVCLPKYPVAVRTMVANAVGKSILRAKEIAISIPKVVTVNQEVRPKRTQVVLTYSGTDKSSTSPSTSPAAKKIATPTSVTGTNTTMDDTALRQEFQELLDNCLTEVRNEFTSALTASEQRITTNLQQTIENRLQSSIERVLATTFDMKLNATNQEVHTTKTEISELKAGMQRLLTWVDQQGSQNNNAPTASGTHQPLPPYQPTVTTTMQNSAPWYPPPSVPYPGPYAKSYTVPQQLDFDSNYGSIYNSQMYSSPTRPDFQSGHDPGYMNNPNQQ